MTETPLAYSYLRFSTPEQMKGDSFRRQTELAEQYAEKNGLKLDKQLMLRDQGISAFRAKNVLHGALGLFLKAVTDGLVPEGSFLLVENLDRVSRATPWDAISVFQLIVNNGVTIVTLQDGKVWSRDLMRAEPWRIFESLLVMIRANEESETKARRLKEAWKGKRAKADKEPMTAQAPKWLMLDKTAKVFRVDEAKAAIVKRIYELAAGGVGQHKTAEILNTEGVKCFGSAAFWHRSYISKILDSDAPIGVYVPHQYVHDEFGRAKRVPLEPIKGYFPAIIEPELNQRAKLLRNGGRATVVREGQTISNMLAGLAKCPVCLRTMTRVSKGPKKKGRPYLVCVAAKTGAGCEYRTVPLPVIEDAITAGYEEMIADAPSGDAEIDPQLEAVEAELWVLKEQAENLARQIAETPLTALVERLSAIEREIEVTTAKRAELRDQLSIYSVAAFDRAKRSFVEAFAGEEPDRAKVNTALRALVKYVRVDYEDGSLELLWKGGGSSPFVYDWDKRLPAVNDG